MSKLYLIWKTIFSYFVCQMLLFELRHFMIESTITVHKKIQCTYRRIYRDIEPQNKESTCLTQWLKRWLTRYSPRSIITTAITIFKWIYITFYNTWTILVVALGTDIPNGIRGLNVRKEINQTQCNYNTWYLNTIVA